MHFLPHPTAMESFAGRRVLAELAGAFCVAQRRSGAAAHPSRRRIALREGESPRDLDRIDALPAL